MELFRVSLAIRIRESLYSCCFLFCILMLCQVPHLEAYEEGDTCMIKQSLPGVCRSSSKCEPIINKYIQTGRLTIRDVPSCGLGPREEIVCCPVAECCDNDKGPSQVQRTTTRTTLQTTTTTEATRISSSMESGKGAANSNLDVESPYFDFQQLLNNKKKPQSQQLKPQPELKPDVPLVTHAASRKLPRSWPEDAQLPAQQGGMEKFQSVGPWGQASAPNQRTPKIINRPQTLMQPRPAFERRPTTVITTRRPQQQQPMDLIQLVNDQLREQGMQIVPAQQVKEIALTSERPIATTTTSTIASIDLDPWAPFRFRGNTNDDIVTNELGNGDVAAFGPETTTVRTFQPTPTTRVDVPTQERPAVRACRFIENRKKEEHLTIHILDGIPVEPGYYPHMAAIAFSNFGNFDYRCGGSLISSRHVLTAAHCFISDMPVHVRLGSVNIAEPTHHQDIAVSQNVMIHPDYVRSSKYNDVAILELVKEAELNFWVYPACLSLDLLDPPLNAQLFVAGWGTMNQTTRRTSKILLRAPLTVVPLPQCNELYAEQPMSVRNLKDGVIDSLMCAADTKESKKDACGGDSGGPLILETDIVNSKYTIMGIINSGFGCATKTPGLYTRVASFLDWIEKIVWPDNVV